MFTRDLKYTQSTNGAMYQLLDMYVLVVPHIVILGKRGGVQYICLRDLGHHWFR